ncbi:Activator of basal transcription 1 [Amphibalanus amphitrite]|uniref:Activator of basal transcription 1 n=1 Tax=Amphibalanus amphitrite TaxID=1232801 RepID=A0A6A4V9F1_AMPAM|nr:Activator of basal transcription 1 [Amphibalanus amphitrite]
MNNQPIGGSKKCKWFDYIWNIKYLPGFKWAHLNERLRFERAVRQDRLRTEVALAKKEANFYLENVERSERQAQRRQRLEAAGKEAAAAAPSGRPGLPFTQRLTTAEILRQKGLTEGREDRLGAMRAVGLFGNKHAPPEDEEGE